MRQMEKILEHQALRNLFIKYCLTVISLAILFAIFAKNFGAPIIADLINTFWTSLLGTLMIGIFLLNAAPKYLQQNQLPIIQPKNIPAEFKAALQNTQSWVFKGSTGSWVRSEVLPNFKARSSAEHKAYTATLHLLDPRNKEACKAYADFRLSLGDKKRNTLESVQAGILATILNCITDQHTFFEIKVYLAQNFSTLRIDVSDECVLITKDQDAAPSLKCPKTSAYYQFYETDLIVQATQNQEINIKSIKYLIQDSSTWKDVAAIFNGLGLSIFELTDQRNWEAVLTEANARQNPYKRNK